ncbi:hypothetical protein U8335_22485 [Roseiconus lacunae]|uniref:hypothetical protein n=1 Tax=Roseiconus lacunae TaxID=2605694 RepID=UPI00308597E9|nr:hypothetical protein U8335_22485 [Stieleria sp. HD01]
MKSTLTDSVNMIAPLEQRSKTFPDVPNVRAYDGSRHITSQDENPVVQVVTSHPKAAMAVAAATGLALGWFVKRVMR